MTVKELIELLNKCPQDALVMYNIENELENEDLSIINKDGGICSEMDFNVDDVLICNGTLQGFVLLTADLLEEADNE